MREGVGTKRGGKKTMGRGGGPGGGGGGAEKICVRVVIGSRGGSGHRGWGSNVSMSGVVIWYQGQGHRVPGGGGGGILFSRMLGNIQVFPRK